jgi:hypothetical protein
MRLSKMTGSCLRDTPRQLLRSNTHIWKLFFWPFLAFKIFQFWHVLALRWEALARRPKQPDGNSTIGSGMWPSFVPSDVDSAVSWALLDRFFIFSKTFGNIGICAMVATAIYRILGRGPSNAELCGFEWWLSIRTRWWFSTTHWALNQRSKSVQTDTWCMRYILRCREVNQNVDGRIVGEHLASSTQRLRAGVLSRYLRGATSVKTAANSRLQVLKGLILETGW